MHRSRGGGGGGGGMGGETGGLNPPLKNLTNIGPDPLKNHKTTKPAFNVGPSSPRQENIIGQ